jgi:molybdopterin/thiamine biosynthesis adenylyltransferase
MNAQNSFAYEQAFCRNRGLLDAEEQRRLRRARVALPGLGGVGGWHLTALVRLGVGAFHLADPDVFETVNIQRQAGASAAALGRSKTVVMAEAALAVNPELHVKTFPEGLTAANMEQFLDGVDVVVDGLDFFALAVRRLLYPACRARGIPVVDAGPVGYGPAVLVFLPNGPTFDAYYRLEETMTRAEMLLAFALGHTRGFGGDIAPESMDFEHGRLPALGPTCMMCGAAAAVEVLKLLCGRGTPAAVPHGFGVDFYRGRAFRLKPRPSLLRSFVGRLIRRMAFARFPALRRMHDSELAAGRLQTEAHPAAVPSPAQPSA